MGGLDDLITHAKRHAYCEAICDVVNILREKNIFVPEIFDLFDNYKNKLKNENKIVDFI